MPGCAAIRCSNSSSKGFLMKHFPKDSERRRLWLLKLKRDNWVPTNYSCICKVSKLYLYYNIVEVWLLGTRKKY